MTDTTTWIIAPAAKGQLGPLIKNVDGRIIACVSGGYPDTDATANLIVAAPKLLKALEALNNWWMTTPSFQDGEDDMPAEIFDGMQDAIAKARGQQ